MREATLRALAAHPDTPCIAVAEVRAGVHRTAEGGLGVTFVVQGDVEALVLPAPAPPQRTDGLWRHTCFECFVASTGTRYGEYNFSPSGAWAAYAFTAYRDADVPPPDFDPRIEVAASARELRLDAFVPAAALPAREAQTPWRIGLSAVIEEAPGVLSYWALRHVPGKPDFHHARAFALEL